MGEMGERAVLAIEAKGLAEHFDFEDLGTRVGNHRGEGATPPMVAGDEVEQEIAFGMTPPGVGLRDDEDGEEFMAESFGQAGAFAIKRLKGLETASAFGQSFLRRDSPQGATM